MRKSKKWVLLLPIVIFVLFLWGYFTDFQNDLSKLLMPGFYLLAVLGIIVCACIMAVRAWKEFVLKKRYIRGGLAILCSILLIAIELHSLYRFFFL